MDVDDSGAAKREKSAISTRPCSHRPWQPGDDHGAVADFVARHYWKIVYRHLRRKGYESERAKDLTQGFFLEIVLKRDLIAKANPTKGRFRPFLFLALNRYLISVRRRTLCRSHIPDSRLYPLDTVEPSCLARDPAGANSGNTSNCPWLSELIQDVLEQVERECHQKDRLVHWCVFRDHVLRPIVDPADCASLKEIGDRYGIDETTVSNRIVTVKRRLRKLLTQHLQRLVVSNEPPGGEIEEIRGFVHETTHKNIGESSLGATPS